MAIDCPRCGLVNPPEAQACDCGLVFGSLADLRAKTRPFWRWNVWGTASLLTASVELLVVARLYGLGSILFPQLLPPPPSPLLMLLPIVFFLGFGFGLAGRRTHPRWPAVAGMLLNGLLLPAAAISVLLLIGLSRVPR